jgi:hypothetical protein
MTDIHVICPHGERHRRIGPDLWESGNWVVGEATAQEAIGGRFYLHESQKAAAWHGGTITGWRPSEEPRRVIFIYRVDGPFRVACAGPWAQEMAIAR